MLEHEDNKHVTGRLRMALAIAAVTAVVASMAIVGTVAAQPGQRFNDVPRTYYAYESIEWAVANGITQGCGDGRNFCPADTLSRAHMVTFLKRYHDKFHSSASPGAGDNGDPDEYTLSDFGSTYESVSLSAGRYRVSLTLEHDRNLSEFASIMLIVEDSDGREETLCSEDTSEFTTVKSYTCRATFEVGTRLGQFDPGRIYFVVAIKDNTDVTGNRVQLAEWEIIVSER